MGKTNMDNYYALNPFSIPSQIKDLMLKIPLAWEAFCQQYSYEPTTLQLYDYMLRELTGFDIKYEELLTIQDRIADYLSIPSCPSAHLERGMDWITEDEILQDDIFGYEPGDEDPVFSQVWKLLQKEALIAAIKTIVDPKQREALTRSFINGKTYKQIGWDQGVTDTTVGDRVQRALLQLSHPSVTRKIRNY